MYVCVCNRSKFIAPLICLNKNHPRRIHLSELHLKQFAELFRVEFNYTNKWKNAFKPKRIGFCSINCQRGFELYEHYIGIRGKDRFLYSIYCEILPFCIHKAFLVSNIINSGNLSLPESILKTIF